jgi:uncharacterized membrane protein
MEQLSNLKVGDIIYHPSLGCMALIEQLSPKDASNLSVRLHGNALFKMTQLISKEQNIWNLYEKSGSKIRMATEEDILNELQDTMCSIDLNESVTLSIARGFNSVYIFDSFGGIFLDMDGVLALKRVLDEVS